MMKPWQAALNENTQPREEMKVQREREDPKSKLEKQTLNGTQRATPSKGGNESRKREDPKSKLDKQP
jgi:hypothetical protein